MNCRRFTPALFLMLTSTYCIAEEGIKEQTITIIEPKERTPNKRAAAIDSEQFEFGISVGAQSVEDFSPAISYGLNFSYHLTDKIITQLNFSRANISKADFETNLDRDFLEKKDRDFQQASLLGGYKILPGRSYLSSNYKFNSAIYLLAGASFVEFAGDKGTAAVVGGSYRLVLTDSITSSLDLKDYIYERNFLSEKKLSHNIEASITINALF
ncbi:outer membrane beta-barrel protein [Sinobacterium caligoides]|uniref:Outer membrane beta-barrel protein n=1 Tax=Sinobacterium caligoides TaxID=933926 RepID=A0A3N2DN16_9GAMM|nr:outer membrane beta-barrel domain-containing protein [Sinobacterium caligoides]ROS01203.1 outer membrane beta-barrel protein [Sinobacterium caligoides]